MCSIVDLTENNSHIFIYETRLKVNLKHGFEIRAQTNSLSQRYLRYFKR